MILSKRAFTQNARDVLPLFFSFFLTAFIGLLLGIVYFQIDYDQRGIQDRLGILFFIVLFACFANFQPVMDTFPSEQKVVMRERAAKSYRVLPCTTTMLDERTGTSSSNVLYIQYSSERVIQYEGHDCATDYISKMLAETPMRIVSTLLFSSIVYWMVGLNPGASNFFIFVAIILLEGLAGLGACVNCEPIDAACCHVLLRPGDHPHHSLWHHDQRLGAQREDCDGHQPRVFGVYDAFCRLLRGTHNRAPAAKTHPLVQNTDSMPAWLSWIRYISFLYYAFSGLTVNEFAGACCWSCDRACLTYNDNGICTSQGNHQLLYLPFIYLYWPVEQQLLNTLRIYRLE